jgi:hypothetical protein
MLTVKPEGFVTPVRSDPVLIALKWIMAASVVSISKVRGFFGVRPGQLPNLRRSHFSTSTRM